VLARAVVYHRGMAHHRWIASGTAALILALEAAALGASGKAGVVVEVDGADAPAVSGEIAQALPDNVTAREPGDLTIALASQGIRGSLVDVLAATKTRKQTLASIHKALTESNAAGILAAQSRRGKSGGHDVHVLLIVRSQAEPVLEEDVSAGKGEKLTTSLVPLLSATLQDVGPGPAAPAPSAPVPAKPSDSSDLATAAEAGPNEKDSVAKKKAPADLATAQIVATAGAELGTRNFAYQDYLWGNVRGYGLAGMAMGSIGLEVYPFAPMGTAVAKDIGFVGRVGYALNRKSETRDGGQSAETSWTRISAGLRGRIRAGDSSSSPTIGLEGTYGQWSFLFSGTDPVVLQTPSVEYKYVRAGADARVPFGAFALLGGAGYMYVLSAGPLGDKFPHATIGEVDLRLGAAYAFSPAFEAQLTATYDRFFMSAHPVAADSYVAGGALDQYVIAHGGIAYAF
jgi:hypothetical protein